MPDPTPDYEEQRRLASCGIRLICFLVIVTTILWVLWQRRHG